MKPKIGLGVSVAVIVASLVGIARYFSTTTLPAPLSISHSPLVTATISPTGNSASSPTTLASQAPTPTLTPGPTIIPGARPSEWNTYRNYEWQFEMKLPPRWKAEQVGFGLVISDDKTAIRIDTDGVGPGGPGSPTITTRTVAGEEVKVADGTFFNLKRNNTELPYYYFRITNWTDTVDNILSTFKSW